MKLGGDQFLRGIPSGLCVKESEENQTVVLDHGFLKQDGVFWGFRETKQQAIARLDV